MTALHYAAYCEDFLEVQHCVEEGYDINQKDHAGWTPLVWCVDMAATSDLGVAERIVDYLIAHGAETEFKNETYANLIEFADSRDRRITEHLKRILGAI